ncbi:MAG TPA: PH domain-containing protein [Candidatus Paceibacterota bacterium]|jgi:uncharacterized membrane protein YdbT with pleckstrin-like domain
MEEFELEPGEHIITQVRQHLFVLFLRLVPYLLLALAPFVLAPVFTALMSTGAADSLPLAETSSSARFFLGLWWLFLWMAIFHIVTKYFLTVWVITSHRIVDIKQIGFFRRRVSSFLLIRVQDVTTDVHGIFATLIGFGNINVETAGSHDTFCMRGIRFPEFIRDLIMREVAALHADENDEPVKTGI